MDVGCCVLVLCQIILLDLLFISFLNAVNVHVSFRANEAILQ